MRSIQNKQKLTESEITALFFLVKQNLKNLKNYFHYFITPIAFMVSIKYIILIAESNGAQS